MLDIGLPDTDGRDVCQAVRAQGIQTPVLFLTARDALTDRLSGFSAGGDDYLAKPFAFAELVARLWALLRRASTDLSIEAGALRLDPVAHAGSSTGAGRADADRVPGPGAAGRQARRSGTAHRSVRAAWPTGARSRQHARRLRRAAAPQAPDASRRAVIETVHGVGYCVG